MPITRAPDRSLGRGFIAAVEIMSTEPEANTTKDEADRKRWPYKLRYKILVAIRADEHAPSLEDVGWRTTSGCAASRT